VNPTLNPSTNPTKFPSFYPSNDPTIDPTTFPTKTPTNNPTIEPTVIPTTQPTMEPVIKTAAPSLLEQFEPYKILAIAIILACCCLLNLVFLIWRRRKLKTETFETHTYDLCTQEGIALFNIPSQAMHTETKNTDMMKARVGSYSTLQNTIDAIEIAQIVTLDELSEEQPGAYIEDEVDMKIVDIETMDNYEEPLKNI